MPLTYTFFYIFDLFSGNLKIEIFYDRFEVEDKDRKTTKCLNKTQIGRLEFFLCDIEELHYRNLNWIFSRLYPRTQCRLVMYLLISYFLNI